jgi:hypothetical protein
MKANVAIVTTSYTLGSNNCRREQKVSHLGYRTGKSLGLPTYKSWLSDDSGIAAAKTCGGLLLGSSATVRIYKRYDSDVQEMFDSGNRADLQVV